MLGRLDERLAADGRTADSAIHDEQQRQISANVTVRNIITSMRHISDVDWSVIFERVSLVDPVLAKGCDFAKMDFATRNLYRTAVEQLARGSGLDELEVANRAVEAAAAATERRRKDPGYYLTAEGRPGVRGRLGLSSVLLDDREPRLSRARRRRLCRRRRSRRFAAARLPDPLPCRGPRGLDLARRARAARRGAGDRFGGGARQPGGDAPVRRRRRSRASSSATECPPICVRWWWCRPC